MKNGEIFYGLMSASVIDFERVPHILSVTRDITKRKLAEINIKKLSIGMEQSPAITLITDVDGKIEYANPKFTEVTGYTFDEIKGKTMRILSASGDLSDEYEDLWETLLDKRDWRGEYLSKKKNGDTYWESVSISPIVNEENEITNFIGIMQDITERKNLTSELLKAKEKAEEMNKIKSYFFANMSHELRTPFVGIMGFAEVLSETAPDQEHKNMAEAILNSAKRLTDTLNKILNVTKLEFDKLNFVYNKFDVCKVVDRVIVLFSKAAELKNIELKSVRSNKSLFITSDEKVIEDALCQLVSNSIKFTNEGKSPF